MSYSHDNPRKIPEGEAGKAGRKSWWLPVVLMASSYFGGYLHTSWKWVLIGPAALSILLIAGRLQVWFLLGNPTYSVTEREIKWRKPRPEYLNAVPRDRL